MVTTKDFTDSAETLKYIAHVQDAEMSKGFQEWLGIIEFILLGFNRLYFNKTGQPKTVLQLIMIAPQIIGFVRDAVRKINAWKKIKQIKPVARVRGNTGLKGDEV